MFWFLVSVALYLLGAYAMHIGTEQVNKEDGLEWSTGDTIMLALWPLVVAREMFRKGGKND